MVRWSRLHRSRSAASRAFLTEIWPGKEIELGRATELLSGLLWFNIGTIQMSRINYNAKSPEQTISHEEMVIFERIFNGFRGWETVQVGTVTLPRRLRRQVRVAQLQRAIRHRRGR